MRSIDVCRVTVRVVAWVVGGLLVACAASLPVRASAEDERDDPSACSDDSECVLSRWICSPCGLCPGAEPRAVLRRVLDEERRACSWERLDAPRAQVQCSPCPPGAAVPRRFEARCVDRQCVRVP